MSYSVEKGKHGWDVVSDGDTYGTALSQEDAHNRASFLNRIGQVYDLLSGITEDLEAIGADEQVFRATETCREAVWETRNVFLGDSVDDLKLLNALMESRKR